MDDLIGLELDLAAQDKPACKGQVYRCRINKYIGKRGEIVSKTTFIPARRLSCAGCLNCRWPETEELLDARCAHPKDGDYYRLAATNITRDWETGIVDGWDTELLPVQVNHEAH